MVIGIPKDVNRNITLPRGNGMVDTSISVSDGCLERRVHLDSYIFYWIHPSFKVQNRIQKGDYLSISVHDFSCRNVETYASPMQNIDFPVEDQPVLSYF